MDITVKDFLSKAWSKRDEVAIHDCNAGSDQKPQYMAVMTAREGYADWIVDAFVVDSNLFGYGKCLHLFIYKD